MDFIKKNLKVLLLGVAALFALLCFATMAGEGVHASANLGSLGTLSGGRSLYDLIGDGNGCAVTALIFVILSVVGSLGLAACECLKVKLPFKWIIGAAFAVLAIVGAIMFFCVPAATETDIGIGVGGVFSGIFQILVAGAFGAFTFFALKK